MPAEPRPPSKAHAEILARWRAQPEPVRQLVAWVAVNEGAVFPASLARRMHGRLAARERGSRTKAGLTQVVSQARAADLLTSGRLLDVAPLTREAIVRDLVRTGEHDSLLGQLDPTLDRPASWWYPSDSAELCQRLRRLLAGAGETAILRFPHMVPFEPLARMVLDPLETGLIANLPPEFRVLALRAVVAHRRTTLRVVEGLDELLLSQARALDLPAAWNLVVGEAMARGELELAERYLDKISGEPLVRDGEALVHLARGDIRRAEKAYAAWLAAMRKQHGNDYVPATLPGTLLPVVWLLRGTASRRKQALTLLRRLQEQHGSGRGTMQDGWPALAPLLDPERKPTDPLPAPAHPMAVLVATLAAAWLDREPPEQAQHDHALRVAERAGYRWLRDELVAARTGDRAPRGALVPLVSHREPESRWSRVLDAIAKGVVPRGSSTRKRADRLIWELRARPFHLVARVQKGKRGGWSKGRLLSDHSVDRGLQGVVAATEQDRRIAACWDRWGRHASELVPGSWQWRGQVWAELVDHPLIFDIDDGERITVAAGQPRVVVRDRPGGRELRLDPPQHSGLVVRAVGRHGFEVIQLDRRQQELARLLHDGLVVPPAGREQLDLVLDGLAQVVEVQSPDQAASTEQPGQPGTVVRLSREGTGLRCELVVQPAGAKGPSLAPGHGSELILARLPDGPLRIRRDLEAELRELGAVRQALAVLDGAGWSGQDWELPELADALELLAQVQALHGRIRVEWLQGQPLKLRRPSAGGFSLAVDEEAGWFEARGSLAVDEGQALELARLLRLLGKRKGRFVELGEDDFLQLSDRLVQQLERLERAGRVQREGIRLHGLAAPILAPVLEQADQTELSPAWQEQVARLGAPPPPVELPVGLEAELRPYQLDGFRWLSRLASWGVGACLADDMGLGKTVQTLALLLARASLGPSLVVAPTSVCPGWREQCWRFTPDLVAYDLRRGDRQATLDSLVPGDIVVCSYGLLLSEQERLARVPWATLVLDESQAIKNPRTQRHQAARSLQAGFRLALTGTPVENRLDELWAQMAVLNPGLLGSEAHFRSRFARPVAEGEREPLRQLRQLVRAVVLRRTKAQVLDELPEKTIVDIGVELEGEEATTYEALRQQAEAATAAMAGEERFQMLAWLTRLRLAACHPRLVVEESTVRDSAKLRALAEIVEGLQEGGHRALVFSQFTSHLDLVQEWLEERGLPYQRLDGSTPAAAREQRVAAFQQGQGLVFLISLRAGGFGLNLTAADYVVHLDPWWNPAVETQASDRAHRIGQQRPVTVYRLFAQGTVEERILELQHAKREVAEALLEGAEAAASLSVDELRRVLVGG